MIKSYLSIGIIMCSMTAVAQNTFPFPSTGNVGIGTTTPIYKLEVKGENSLLRLVTSNSSVPYPAIDVYNSSSGTEFVLSPSADKVDLFTYSNHPLALGTGATEKMRISANGYVGIGTISPAENLSVIASNNHTNQIGFGIAGEEKAALYRADASGLLLYSSILPGANSSIHLLTGGTLSDERMTISGNGNVGIGTITPTEKLAVNGKIRAKEIKIEAANWPDYVFAKDYPLPSLQQTETHIKEKGHLPGIPSAAEVKANGIDLGEMNAKLLQKIEELTLHLIEMKKENRNLIKRVSHLENNK